VFCPSALRSRTAAANVRGSRGAEAGWIVSAAASRSLLGNHGPIGRGKSENFAIFGEEADGFPLASVRAGKLRRREAVRLADIRYAPERKTRPSCLVQD
jgi:hypothetical protein